jgi:hypothetical protein
MKTEAIPLSASLLPEVYECTTVSLLQVHECTTVSNKRLLGVLRGQQAALQLSGRLYRIVLHPHDDRPLRGPAPVGDPPRP